MRAPGPLPTKPFHPIRGCTLQVWWHRPCIGTAPGTGSRRAPRSRGKAERSEQSMSKSVDGSTDVGLEVFSTCTQSTDGAREAYVQRVADVARWSEQAGCKGILVYSDNRLVAQEGAYYTVKNLKVPPPLAPELFPGIFVSGSSDAGLAAAQAIGAVAVKYPKAPEEEVAPNEGVGAGVRVGIVAREDGDEAWRIARERFPEDRRGQLTHQLAMKVSDSVWHGQLSDLADATASGDSPYWLVPFQNYKTMCPYLVGSYERVGGELSRYIAVGYRSFILDIPPTEEDLHHTNRAFHRAMTLVTR